MPVDFEIHLEFRADSIGDARAKMTEILGYIGALGEGPDSCCISFNDTEVQKDYENRLMAEMKI